MRRLCNTCCLVSDDRLGAHTGLPKTARIRSGDPQREIGVEQVGPFREEVTQPPRRAQVVVGRSGEAVGAQQFREVREDDGEILTIAGSRRLRKTDANDLLLRKEPLKVNNDVLSPIIPIIVRYQPVISRGSHGAIRFLSPTTNAAPCTR